jgi:ferritin
MAAPIISSGAAASINAQISHELHNEQQYRAFGSWASNLGLSHLAAYFVKQADDERGHAQRFIDYLIECNQPLAILAIDAPQSAFGDVAEIADLRFALETTTTDQVNSIMDTAMRENDYGLQDLMQWFCREQKSEMAEALRLVSLARLSGGNAILLDLAVEG